MKMSSIYAVYFIYGYAHAIAENMKADGCFPDLTIEQLVNLLMEEVLNEI